MNQSDLAIFSDIINELDATAESNCPFQLLKIVELLGKLAREHWLQKDKGDLWQATQNIWLDLREQVSLYARRADPRASPIYMGSKVNPELRDLVFLAEVAAHGTRDRQRAHIELERLLRKSGAESSPVYRTIEIIHELLPCEARPTKVLELRPVFKMFDVQDHDLPTLTRRRVFGQSAPGVLSFQVGFREPPELDDLLIEVHRGNEGAIFRILEMFDSKDSPRVRNSCVEALRLIGGCVVSQELSARVATNPLYAQCLVLCALDGLASQPYRPPSDESETLSLQRHTVRTVLNRLLEFEPHSEDLKAIRASAIEGVERTRRSAARSNHGSIWARYSLSLSQVRLNSEASSASIEPAGWSLVSSCTT
jgi:hypothetical protein